MRLVTPDDRTYTIGPGTRIIWEERSKTVVIITAGGDNVSIDAGTSSRDNKLLLTSDAGKEDFHTLVRLLAAALGLDYAPREMAGVDAYCMEFRASAPSGAN